GLPPVLSRQCQHPCKLDTMRGARVSSQTDEFFATEPFRPARSCGRDSDAPLASVSGNGSKKGALSSGEKVVKKRNYRPGAEPSPAGGGGAPPLRRKARFPLCAGASCTA